MNACALCRWMGSAPPGAYSTVIIETSRPGISVRSFDISDVTLASCAITVPVERNSKTTVSFMFFIIDLSFVAQGPYWPKRLWISLCNGAACKHPAICRGVLEFRLSCNHAHICLSFSFRNPQHCIRKSLIDFLRANRWPIRSETRVGRRSTERQVVRDCLGRK